MQERVRIKIEDALSGYHHRQPVALPRSRKENQKRIHEAGSKLWMVAGKERGTDPDIPKTICRIAMRPINLHGVEIRGVKDKDTGILKKL